MFRLKIDTMDMFESWIENHQVARKCTCMKRMEMVCIRPFGKPAQEVGCRDCQAQEPCMLLLWCYAGEGGGRP